MRGLIFSRIFFCPYLFCSLLSGGGTRAVWHLDPRLNQLAIKESRLVVLSSSASTQACRGDALSLRVLLPGTTAEWSGAGRGGLRCRAKNVTRYCSWPWASLSVNYAVSCTICFVPGWQEAAGARGHATQRTALGWGVLLYMACECDIEEGPRFVPVVLLTCHKGWMSEMGDFCVSVWERGVKLN